MFTKLLLLSLFVGSAYGLETVTPILMKTDSPGYVLSGTKYEASCIINNDGSIVRTDEFIDSTRPAIVYSSNLTSEHTVERIKTLIDYAKTEVLYTTPLTVQDAPSSTVTAYFKDSNNNSKELVIYGSAANSDIVRRFGSSSEKLEGILNHYCSPIYRIEEFGVDIILEQ